ncbi:MAG TPA: YggT family protein [Halanaerobiaceae bacterium]|jgi:YggT family protein|nr:YggT family protein [Bacillota bacterium]HHU91596.1 YggT family protein [Halanaerobiaceae bacterium]HOA40744.1 YggT family protein [Halanaerobiales bacterium]HPZ62246.1 YggT family protein [Halanaerobiales bacterium]HQD03598.1 YggT family protein [Halanaerobiales bacterium]
MYFLSYLIRTIFNIFSWLIIIRTIISWLAPDIYNHNWRNLLRLLYKLTEPILKPIREYLPTVAWGLDFSPLIALLLLNILRSFILRLLYYLAIDLGI